MIQKPLWLEDLTDYSGTDMRRLIAATFPGAGVIDGGDLTVEQHGAGNRSVDVTAGMAVVAGTAVPGQGAYLFDSDGTVNVPLDAAPGSGQSRNDLIVVRIQDVDTDGGATNAGQIAFVKGTPAATGSQVDPSLPTSCLLLARAVVGPSVTTILTANITDLRSNAFEVPCGVLVANGAEGIGNDSSPENLANMDIGLLRGGMAATLPGPSFLTVPVHGVYDVKATVAFDLTGGLTLVGGQRFGVQALLNGTVGLAYGEQAYQEAITVSFGTPSFTACADCELFPGDEVSLRLLQAAGSGSGQSIDTVAGQCGLSVRLVSRLP